MVIDEGTEVRRIGRRGRRDVPCRMAVGVMKVRFETRAPACCLATRATEER